MTRKISNIAESVRARLLNIARAERIDFDALLLRYLQERFLYRLSISKYADKLVLKGGLLLLSLDFPMARPTKDIDFLVQGIDDDIPEVKRVVLDIIHVKCNDGVDFSKTHIETEKIKEDTEYEGLRLKITGSLGQARKKLQLDFGFGDVITPKARRMTYPTILDTDKPQLMVYSIESVIAEKFEAMIKLSLANSRMKDFYDVYLLSKTNNFSLEELSKAINNTFKRRKTELPKGMPYIFTSEFYEDEQRKKQWRAFLRKSNLLQTENDFGNIMKHLHKFLKPVLKYTPVLPHQVD